MNRQEVEDLSRKLTADYGVMIREMLRDQVEDTVIPEPVLNELYFFRVNGISKNWDETTEPVWKKASELFTGLHSLSRPIVIVFKEENGQFYCYIGTTPDVLELLPGVFRGVFRKMDIYGETEGGGISLFSAPDVITPGHFSFGGYIKGDPTSNMTNTSSYPMDEIIRGMSGKDWCITIAAYPENKKNSIVRSELWMTTSSNCSEVQQVTITEEYRGGTFSHNKNYSQCQIYSDVVEGFVKRSNEAVSKGEWVVSVNYATNDEMETKLLGAMIVSAFFGEDSYPEPIHAISMEGENIPVPKCDILHYDYLDSVGYPRYATILSSEGLAKYALFPLEDIFGFSITDYVSFNKNRLSDGNMVLGRILDDNVVTENEYRINVNELNRHCLVAGLTGSGKTNTIKSIICSTNKNFKVPFLIIEPAKKEYWELYNIGFENVQVYSVGSGEKFSHRLCINPFERIEVKDEYGNSLHVPIQTHIDFVYSAFKASFIMYTPMPYVLERAIYEIYEDLGWDIHNDYNPNGEVYPTMEDLYYKIADVIEDNGYDAKMKQDLTGSLQARINSMRIGTKGDTLNVAKSFPIEKLLNDNVIIELEDIGDDDVKAFIISILLILLLEYRRQQPDAQLEVKHLLFIEEAHRLLKNVQSGSGENADPRGAAVEFFCNLLAELRSKGQGFIVADQIPSKLAPDLIKNTNLKIVHRTVAEEERVLIGGSMHMTEEQIDYLSSLKQGVAAVYSEGDNRPILVKPKYAGSYAAPDKRALNRREVLEAIGGNCVQYEGNPLYQSLTGQRSRLCMICKRDCRKSFKDILDSEDMKNGLSELEKRLDPNTTKKCRPGEIDREIMQFLTNIKDQSFAMDIHNRICVFHCLTDRWHLNNDVMDAIHRYYREKLREGD